MVSTSVALISGLIVLQPNCISAVPYGVTKNGDFAFVLLMLTVLCIRDAKTTLLCDVHMKQETGLKLRKCIRQRAVTKNT